MIIQGGFPESIDVLRNLSAEGLAEIRFIEPSDAMTRFGSKYAAGMIVVRLQAQVSEPFN